MLYWFIQGTCGWNNFLCSNLQCRPFTLTCDGNDNCGDGSDENNVTCNTIGFTPKNRVHIYVIRFCECNQYCTFLYSFQLILGNVCRLNQFKCDNKNCIPRSFLCNGRDDCGDNSDEMQNCKRNTDKTFTTF